MLHIEARNVWAGAHLILSFRYFASEIIGNVLDLEPRRWRHPKRVDFRQNQDRVAKFKKKYETYDWTGMIGQR